MKTLKIREPLVMEYVAVPSKFWISEATHALGLLTLSLHRHEVPE